MPAADISQVQVTFGNGIKREEYGPLKKAEVSIIAIVDQNADGVAALNYISKIAQDKVKELLLAKPPEASVGEPSPPTSSASPASPSEASDAEMDKSTTGEAQPPAAAEPQRRTRRTKEQIAADAAAAAAQQSTSAETPASEPTASTADEDEWSAAAPETVTITDAELNSACTDTSKRIGAGAPIKALIGTFSPGGDAWDPDKGGRKFAVNDIAPNQRADFIAKLKQLN